MDPSTEEHLEQLLRELTYTQNWDQVQRLLHTHPEILSSDSIALFDYVIDQLESHEQHDTARAFRRHCDTLRRAREIGVDQTIAMARADSNPLPPDMGAIVEQLYGPKSGALTAEQESLLAERALKLTSRDRSPTAWAALQGTLGTALLKQQSGDLGANAERALNAFQAASTVISKSVRPALWAINTIGQADAYLRRTNGNRAENLGHAAAAFREVLDILTEGSGSTIGASLDHDSRKSLLELSNGSPQDLKKAIDNVHRALLIIVQGENERH